MNCRDSRGPLVADSPRLFARQDRAIDLNEAFHRELRAKHPRRPLRNAGWDLDWVVCPACDEDPACMNCGGEGGWPASATRHDNAAHELGEDE